jgi:hypothetical protein
MISSKIPFLAIIFILNVGALSAQNNELHVFLGLTNYQGELNPQRFTTKGYNRGLGLIFRHGLSPKLFVRAGIQSGFISASDSSSGDNKTRNLSFSSNIFDGHVALEYRLFTPEQHAITPYAFAGLGVFNFNPFVRFGPKDEKVFLQPLGTEGQGLPEYPDRKLYRITQLNIPFGGGLLWHVNEKLRIGGEIRLNKTFTDYLDDVSTNYALQGPLLRDRGQLAVDLAWRRDEVDGTPYPTNQLRRGNPENDDWYYYIGITVGFALSSGSRYYKQGRSAMGCPKW